MNKQILYVGRDKSPRANPWLAGLRKYGVIKVKKVYDGNEAIDEINSDTNKYSLVFVGNLGVPMTPSKDDLFEHGFEIVRQAKEKGLSVVVMNSHGITYVDMKLRKMEVDVFDFSATPIAYAGKVKRLLEKSN